MAVWGRTVYRVLATGLTRMCVIHCYQVAPLKLAWSRLKRTLASVNDVYLYVQINDTIDEGYDDHQNE